MTTEVQNDPLNLLLKMQQARESSELGLPEQNEATPKWRGIGTRIGDQNLVIAMHEVNGIVPTGRLTPVPLAKSWVQGVANVRGVLVTVIDLPQFLGETPVAYDEHTRMLVINAKGMQTGMLVDEVLGLRQFEVDQDTFEVSSLDVSVWPYVQRGFHQDGILWGVFDMTRLIRNERFKHISIKHDETIALG